jgi:predicted alpha/beta-hydrolase family hydrolase
LVQMARSVRMMSVCGPQTARCSLWRPWTIPQYRSFQRHRWRLERDAYGANHEIMSPLLIETKFVATPEKGEVSAILMLPHDAMALIVIGHGASTNMRHATLQTIADRMSAAGIATLRYNFPYMEHGRGRDSQAVCTETVRSAVRKANELAPDLVLLAGGHSFGGRMTSHAAAEAPLKNVSGLVFFSFPLHQPGKPEIKRAAHLPLVDIPMLFLSGTRDDLADVGLLQGVCAGLGKQATLHLLDTADHGYKVLKKSRTSKEDVFDEMARTARAWASAGILKD